MTQKIILINPDKNDPIDVLAKVGGLEIAGIAGIILAAAANRVPVIVDGFIPIPRLHLLLGGVSTFLLQWG